MGTSGVRDIITYLVENKLVHCVVTSTGGLEEDIIKTYGDFYTEILMLMVEN